MRLKYWKAKGPSQSVTGQLENENMLSHLLSETALFKTKPNLAKKDHISSWVALDIDLNNVKVNEEKQSEKPYLHNSTVNYSTIQPPEFLTSF